MTATDTIRAMLDERGVEHWDTVGITEFRGENDRTVRCYARPEPMTLDVAIVAAPPEQAIEATLGRGECRNLISHIQGQMPMLHCEECGCTTTLNVPSSGAGYIGETEMDWPLYCANCGRAVRA